MADDDSGSDDGGFGGTSDDGGFGDTSDDGGFGDGTDVGDQVDTGSLSFIGPPESPTFDSRFGDDGMAGLTTASSPSEGSTADAAGFSVSLPGLGDVNSSLGGLVDDGRGLVSGLGSMNLDPGAFGGIGSPVGIAAQSLSGSQMSALGSTFSVLGSVNDGIGLSNAGYQNADQQVSTSLGGLTEPAAGTSPYGNLLGVTPTSGLPTFTDLSSDQAAAVDTLNAQAQQTPTDLADDPTMQAQLAQHEASKNHVYTDTAGHPTVGIGFNLDRSGARDAMTAVGADYDAVRAGTQDLTDDQITQLAHTDTQHAVDVARNYYSGFDQLDPARQRALVDMSFNLDNKINQFTGLHQALVNGDYNAAADHISNSLFARQTGVRGTDLTDQMRNGGQ